MTTPSGGFGDPLTSTKAAVESLRDFTPGALGEIYQYIQGRLPLAKIPAGTSTVTDITTIGTPADGQQALVRAGATPYDFVQVTYDLTTAQWVSDPGLLTGNLTATGTVTAYADVSVNGPLLPWKVLDTAGFKPQYRLTFVTSTDGTHAVFGALQLYAGDIGGVVASQGAVFGAQTSVTNVIILDSGWVNTPGSLTVKDMVGVRPQWKQASSGSGAVTNVSVLGRWVSK